MKKTTLIICCSLLALCTAVIGAFAYFSDSVTASVEGDIGTVDIELVDTEPSITGKQTLELTNKDRVFPGAEHFPYDPSIVNENLPSHRLYFHVHNKGMKSVRTRNIIDIIVTSAPNADGETRNLDPTKFSLFEKSSVAPYNNTDLSLLEDLAVQKFTYVNDEGETVLRYIIQGGVINGLPDLIEDNDVVLEDNVRDSLEYNEPADIAKYSYYLGFDPYAPNEYQGAVVTINLEVQAIQFRNTSGTDIDGDWVTHLSATLTTGQICSGN